MNTSDNFLIIKNRPMRHYALLLFSWIVQKKTHTTLTASGNGIGKLLDFINLSNLLFPGLMKVQYDHSVNSMNHVRISQIVAQISFDQSCISKDAPSMSNSEFSTCMLSVLLNTFFQKHDIRNIELFSTLERADEATNDFSVPVARLDVRNLVFDVCDQPVNKEVVKGKQRDWVRQRVRDALIRCGVLKGDYSQFIARICAYDDVLFGIDTNVLYNCTATTALLDSTVGIPSYDFLDTPNWIAILISRMVIAEIDHAANEPKATYKGRQAMRALQELMLIKNCKDISGVSVFIRGPIRLGMGMSQGHRESNTIKDSLIREDFCECIKDIGLHKGAFFISHDFAACTMAEAEGLDAFYLPKPKLIDKVNLWTDGNGCSIAELLYEMAVSFCPLKVVMTGADGTKYSFILESEWPAKELNNWEQWILRCRSEDVAVNQMIADLREDPIARKILAAWDELNKRYSFVR